MHGVIDADGIVRPGFELQTDNANAEIKKYLRGEIEADGKKSEGFIVEDWSGMSEGPGLWVHTFERNVKAGWTAEQVSIEIYCLLFAIRLYQKLIWAIRFGGLRCSGACGTSLVEGWS